MFNIPQNKVTFLKTTQPDGSLGWVAVFSIDISLDSQFKLDLRALKAVGQQIKIVPRSCSINNTPNANPVSVTYDDVLQYPNEAAAGQIRTFQLPGVDNPTSIIFETTQVGPSTIIDIFLYSYPATPDVAGGVGTLVTVVGTVPVTVQNTPNVVDTSGETTVAPFSGITAAGSTAILAAKKTIFRVTLYASGNTIMAAAGLNLIELMDNATVIGQFKPYFPAAAFSGVFGQKIGEFKNKNGYAMVNNTLNLNLGTALTGGNLYGEVEYK